MLWRGVHCDGGGYREKQGLRGGASAQHGQGSEDGPEPSLGPLVSAQTV